VVLPEGALRGRPRTVYFYRAHEYESPHACRGCLAGETLSSVPVHRLIRAFRAFAGYLVRDARKVHDGIHPFDGPANRASQIADGMAFNTWNHLRPIVTHCASHSHSTLQQLTAHGTTDKAVRPGDEHGRRRPDIDDIGIDGSG